MSGGAGRLRDYRGASHSQYVLLHSRRSGRQERRIHCSKHGLLMKVECFEIDSKVLGGNVLAVSDFDPAIDFSEFERRYVEEFRPIYVSCKIPLERISDIQILENHGFGLIEAQIRASV